MSSTSSLDRLCRTGRPSRTTSRRRSPRSRPPSGRGSRPPAAPSTTSWPRSRTFLRGRDRRHPGDPGARRGGVAGHRLRRHRGRHGQRGDAGAAQAARLRRRPRALRPRPGRAVGPRRRRLRRLATSSSRTTPGRPTTSSAPWRRDEQARDLPGLLVERPDGGAPASADGHGAGVPELASGPPRPTVTTGSTPTRTASIPTGSAAARRVPTPAAWAPTSTPARSTCG